MTPNTWISLRDFIEEVVSTSALARLDHPSQRLLEWIAKNYNKTNPIYMQTLVMKSGVASPATIYKCVEKLSEINFLSVTVDATDQRRRIITPTAQAMRLMNELAHSAKAWAKSVGV
jgi:DNA-binding MarR family transcriptional regulator